jgi:hypothetical protein
MKVVTIGSMSLIELYPEFLWSSELGSNVCLTTRPVSTAVLCGESPPKSQTNTTHSELKDQKGKNVTHHPSRQNQSGLIAVVSHIIIRPKEATIFGLDCLLTRTCGLS